VFADKCVRGIRANRERCLTYAERTGALVTAIAPVIGYDEAARIYERAMAEDKPIREAILDSGKVSAETVDEVLDLKRLAEGGRPERS
jgi:fumarate hydratase class II